MTLQTFYRNLRKYAHLFEWSLEEGKIRAYKDGNQFCPITAVLFGKKKVVFIPLHAGCAGNLLKLDTPKQYIIIKYADKVYKSIVRKTLLNSVNLKEM